ncbi:MAG: imidazole glycerol phosphate synthase subunit HisF [Nanoarchaeota archaeon]
MLTKRIIPCMDVKDGRVVKGVKFISLKDAGDPVELGKWYNEQGADELVFLDITASVEARKTTLEMVRAVAKNVFIPFTVGGGINTVEDIRAILRAGADKVSLNTAIVRNPSLITKAAKNFGSQCIVAAIDVKKTKKQDNREDSWEVFVKGGREPAGKDAIAWAKEVEVRGAGEILLTSMDADGTKEGYDITITKKIAEAVNIPIIASGGAGNLASFEKVFKEGKADAALAASVFHYKKYTIQEVKGYLRQKKVEVRSNEQA